MKEKFKIEGMTCSSCQSHVQKAVEKLEGITTCNVNLLANTMDVSYDQSIVTSEQIKDAVKKAGYLALDMDQKQSVNPSKEKDNQLRTLILSACFAIMVFYLAMGPMLHIPIPSIFAENGIILALTELLLTIPVIFLNFHYFTTGYKRLFKGSPNMDTLIAVGSSASFIYGIVILYQMAYQQNQGLDILHLTHELYFESSSTILVLVSFGKYLESKSKKKTNESIRKLMDLAPKNAILYRDGEEIEIPVEQVQLGDILVVKKGMQVPVDGYILEGSGSFDQSNITGESIPVFKQQNQEVISSTILTNGYILLKATKVGEDTTIHTIIKLVEEAANSKAPISKLADRISFFFVPTVMLIALISFIVFCFLEGPAFAFGIGISVLVIACPCALGLATPVAIMVATGVAARNGLLIKNAEILEKTHSIQTIILDKTGTITEGKPKVIDLISFTNENSLEIAYSLEIKSEHPLATAIITKGKEENCNALEVKDYESFSGMGIQGTIGEKQYMIGNQKLLDQFHIDYQDHKEDMNDLAQSGKTPLYLADQTKLLAIITIQDPIKEDSKEAIEHLQELGLKVIMLTGDNQLTANSIAEEIGITDVISDVFPDQKQQIVKDYQEKDQHVAMVGDGVNDAPALMQADIGIAIGRGADIAIDAADIVLVSNSLNDVYAAIKLSKKTIHNIKGNLFWAFFYNAVGILFAAGVFYYVWHIKLNPMISALAMSFSSVFVVTNALRLNTFKIKKGRKQEMNAITLSIEGMMCKHCQARVEKALTAVPGVSKVEVNLKKKNAIVYYDGSTPEALVQAVVAEGYDAKLA